MTRKIHKKEEIDSFFSELLNRCKQQGVYSVKETIESMGVNYDTVKKWTEKEESYDDMFQICRSLCASHAEVDGLTFKIPAEKAFEHMFECNDEFIALYPTPEAQQELIESVKKEKQQRILSTQ